MRLRREQNLHRNPVRRCSKSSIAPMMSRYRSVRYARHKGWLLEDAVVRLSHHRIHADDCRDCNNSKGRVDLFERELELNGNLHEAQRQRLLEIAGKCPVHRTLTSELRIETTLRQV
ncbi:MAG: hypothetical protein HXX11_22775 [Desulfuromonadales bacterium]|nr:hypothetical protein [Desulfuromonadales bacterium]